MENILFGAVPFVCAALTLAFLHYRHKAYKDGYRAALATTRSRFRQPDMYDLLNAHDRLRKAVAFRAEATELLRLATLKAAGLPIYLQDLS
jgi:hypothetical protein